MTRKTCAATWLAVGHANRTTGGVAQVNADYDEERVAAGLAEGELSLAFRHEEQSVRRPRALDLVVPRPNPPSFLLLGIVLAVVSAVFNALPQNGG
jgi:hypothetical protein